MKKNILIFSVEIVFVLILGDMVLPPVIADTGGPGTGGRYIWTDSNPPPPVETYYWREIAGPEGGTGTEIERNQWNYDIDDGCFNIQTIGFDFKFYGNTYSDVYVCTNGFLNFGTCYPEFANVCIPDSPVPDDMIAPFWDDLDLSNFGGASVYYQLQGGAPERELIVEWYKVPHIEDSASRLTFQAILFEGSNEILCQYNSLTDSGGDLSKGSSATLGIEGPFGILGLGYSCDQPVVSEGLAVRYSLFEESKWIQLPNVIDGYDWYSSYYAPAYFDLEIADDWKCIGGKPIYKVRWYGSYLNWMSDTSAPVDPPLIEPTYFRLSWYEYTHPGSFSRPGALITEEVGEWDLQTYIGAREPMPITMPGWWEHDWIYEKELDNPWFQSDGYYYFLGIQAVYTEEPYYYWGWFNAQTVSQWNDAAVFSSDGGTDWSPLTYMEGHRLEGEWMDMAFELFYSLATPTPSPSVTPSPTPTPTSTITPTPSSTSTPSVTPTPSVPPTSTPTPSVPPPTPVITPTPLATPAYLVLDTGDFNGDGTSEIIIYRAAEGLWAIRDLSRVYFGGGDDIPASGDYDGDDTTDICVVRPASGLWSIRGFTRFYFGQAGDIPAPADYDSGGWTDQAIFRPSTGMWAGILTHQGEKVVYFGAAGDFPVPADYNNDNWAEVAIFRPSTGLWAIRNFTRFYFGGVEDTPIARDYDSDGYSDPAVFRPGSGLWAVRGITRVYLGRAGDNPMPADYTGDGIIDLSIFRQDCGLWTVSGVTRLYFGVSGDIPLSR